MRRSVSTDVASLGKAVLEHSKPCVLCGLGAANVGVCVEETWLM